MTCSLILIINNSQTEILFPLDGSKRFLPMLSPDSEHRRSRNNMQRSVVALLFADGLSYKHERLADFWTLHRLLQRRICHMLHSGMLIL